MADISRLVIAVDASSAINNFHILTRSVQEFTGQLSDVSRVTLSFNQSMTPVADAIKKYTTDMAAASAATMNFKQAQNGLILESSRAAQVNKQLADSAEALAKAEAEIASRPAAFKKFTGFTSTEELQQNIIQMRALQQVFGETSDKGIALGRSIASAEKEITNIGKSGYKTKRDFTDLFRELLNARKGVQGFVGGFLRIGTGTYLVGRAIQATTQLLVGMIKPFTDAAGAMQQMEAAYSTLASTPIEGKQLLSFSKQLSSELPITVQAIDKANRTLLGFGFTVKEIEDVLPRMANISQGNSEQFEHLALVYGQVRAQGKAMQQDMYQFVNAGVPIMEALAEVIKKPTSEIRTMVREGSIGLAEFDAALKLLTDEGGRFHDYLTQASDTLQGQLTIAASNLKLILGEAGKGLVDSLKEAVKVANNAARTIGGQRAVESALAFMHPSAAGFNVPKASPEIAKSAAAYLQEQISAQRIDISNREAQIKQLGLGPNSELALELQRAKDILARYTEDFDAIRRAYNIYAQVGGGKSPTTGLTTLTPEQRAALLDFEAKREVKRIGELPELDVKKMYKDMAGVYAELFTSLGTILENDVQVYQFTMTPEFKQIMDSFMQESSIITVDSIKNKIMEEQRRISPSKLGNETRASALAQSLYYSWLAGQGGQGGRKKASFMEVGPPTPPEMAMYASADAYVSEQDLANAKALLDLIQYTNISMQEQVDSLLKARKATFDMFMPAELSLGQITDQVETIIRMWSAMGQTDTPFMKGFKEGLNSLKEYEQALGSLAQTSTLDFLKTSFETLGNYLATGTWDTSSMLNWFQSLASQTSTLFIQAGLSMIITGTKAEKAVGLGLLALGGITAITSGIMGAGSSDITYASATQGNVPYAMGGIFANNPSLASYSNGVYNSPRIFAFARGAGVFAEAGPEAIMPLTRGRNGKLGVDASGAVSNITFQFVDQSKGGLSADVSQSTDAQGNKVLRATVRDLVASEIASGSMDKVLQSRGMPRYTGRQRS